MLLSHFLGIWLGLQVLRYSCSIYTSFWTKNSHSPLIDVSHDNASPNGNDYHHHDQPQHITCEKRKKRYKIRGSRFSYNVVFRVSKQVCPARTPGMDPSRDPGFVPSVPRSFFSLEFICTLWLMPMTGCTAAASLREGKVSAGSNTCSSSWEGPTSAVGTGAEGPVASVERGKNHIYIYIYIKTTYQALMSTSKHVPWEWDSSRLRSTLKNTCSPLSCCQKSYHSRQEMYSSPQFPLTWTYLTKSPRHHHRWEKADSRMKLRFRAWVQRCTMTSFSV